MKQYKIKMWVDANPTEVVVTAKNSTNAKSIARKLYPMARVVNAKEI